MAKRKNLSNPFSTGGGGSHFEAHVQASFVALMLTNGHAPCLPCWPIKEIKLQGKIDGIETDDLVVVVQDSTNKERRKLLGQIKHSIAITQGSTLFGEVIQAAWKDFTNPKVFTRRSDIIALITGPLSWTDAHNVQWLLNQARHTKSADEFYRNARHAKFSPSKSGEKLNVFQHHLKMANGGNEVSEIELHDFLKHFHLLGYDLGNEFGVVLSLLHSHIAQFQQQFPEAFWSMVVDTVQTWNQDAGTITSDNLPPVLLEAFKQRVVKEIPEEFKGAQEEPKTEEPKIDWSQHGDATYLALAILIGAWNEKNQGDIDVITQLFGIDYDQWLKKAREVLHLPESPLSLNNGIWKVANRTELWNLLGSRILDQDLDTFKSLAIKLFKEPEPAFGVLAEERNAVSIVGKLSGCSQTLRTGVAEGLAILGSRPDACTHCTQGKAEAISVLVVRELLSGAGGVHWGSLSSLLPILAEAAPGEFLAAVEKASSAIPCPFDELFPQEGNGFVGRNYLAGLLWALEGLAWDEQYLVRVCVALAELASHDPGGRSANRPSNSLVTILLPWFPQTLAPVDKRKVAAQILLTDWPDIAWNLIIQLLPGQRQTSSGSHKLRWRMTIPDDWGNEVTPSDYWQQVSFYAVRAVEAAGTDTARLSTLVDHFDKLPQPAFDQLAEILCSKSISALPEAQRLPLWDRLVKFANKHRRYSKAKWALPVELINRIEKIAEELAPTSPFNLYQRLFNDHDSQLFAEDGNWQEQQKQLDTRRQMALSEILQQDGADGVIRFAESVVSPRQVGYALGVIGDNAIEQTLLPHFLATFNNKRKALLAAFVWQRCHIKGWDWCDNIDKSSWTPEQKGRFLACLPFTKNTWDRAREWLQGRESEYWTRTDVNAYQADGDLPMAIEKLIEHGRPNAAISCLDQMRHAKRPIDAHQCILALRAAVSSREYGYVLDEHRVVELIKFLESDNSVNSTDLFEVEWTYLPLLNGHGGASPKLLERKLVNEPEYFCKMIHMIFRSTTESQPAKEPAEESKTDAINAWRLLDEWKTPPGTQEDGTFSKKYFEEWLQYVKKSCTESGHLEVALSQIGKVLIHAPVDPDGLWINRAVAAALNDREAEHMRNGFVIGTYNLRGAHWVDPTGAPERGLAETFRRHADEVENAGFSRFAVTLRDLADGYDREAERIIDTHKDRGDGQS